MAGSMPPKGELIKIELFQIRGQRETFFTDVSASTEINPAELAAQGFVEIHDEAMNNKAYPEVVRRACY